MATLGAELGCGRHLASTVVTGSGQWSSTFLAELCLSTVLVLALRAFHCRPRRKKRARCPARVTSRMADASRFSCGGQDRHRRLLVPRCQRPPGRRGAEKRDELPPSHVEHGGLLPLSAISPPTGLLLGAGRIFVTSRHDRLRRSFGSLVRPEALGSHLVDDVVLARVLD